MRGERVRRGNHDVFETTLRAGKDRIPFSRRRGPSCAVVHTRKRVARYEVDDAHRPVFAREREALAAQRRRDTSRLFRCVRKHLQRFGERACLPDARGAVGSHRGERVAKKMRRRVGDVDGMRAQKSLRVSRARVHRPRRARARGRRHELRVRGTTNLACSAAAGNERRRVTRRHRAVERELAELVPVPRVSFAFLFVDSGKRVLRKQHARAPC